MSVVVKSMEAELAEQSSVSVSENSLSFGNEILLPEQPTERLLEMAVLTLVSDMIKTIAIWDG